MNAATDGLSPAEIEAVRQVLTNGQEALRIGRAPWTRLEARRRAATARRRALVAGVAVAASAALAGAVLTGRGWHTATPVQPDRPVNGTYGTLAGDDAFVRALRESAPGFGANTRRPGAGAVRVLVATEVGGVRLALLRTTAQRQGGQWWWAEGQSGAPAALLDGTFPCPDPRVCWRAFGLLDRPVRRPGVAEGVVVAAPPGSHVRVTGSGDVLPGGTLRRSVTDVPERWPGIFVAEGPSGRSRLDLEVRFPGGGEPWRNTWTSWDTRFALPSSGPATRGNGLTGPAGSSFPLAAAMDAAGVVAARQPAALLLAHDGDVQRAVYAVPGRSGGWAAVAVRQGRPGESGAAAPGRMLSFAVQAVMPRPAGDPDDFALAWPDPWSGPGAVVLLGPRGAVRAEVSTARGTLAVPLADGFGTARAAGATRVRFFGPAGTEVARTDLAPAYRGTYDGF